MNVYTSIIELIGNTPLLHLRNYQKKHELAALILGKLEYYNPAGSSKDRIALSMIEEAEREGKLHPHSVIIEPTSGNTGIGIAAIARIKGYRTIIVMPDNLSQERITLLKALGAEVVLSDGDLNMKGAGEKAEELAKQIPNSHILYQGQNPANPLAHRKTTGPEIWRDTDGKVDIFIASIGTGGTITGVGEYLKEKNPNIQIIGVEPAGSPVLSKGYAGPHKIQGIGGGAIPEILNTEIYDEIIAVTDEDAYNTSREITHTEGIFLGISSGAVIWAAKQLAERKENKEKVIVTFLPDSGNRYLSTDLYEEMEA